VSTAYRSTEQSGREERSERVITEQASNGLSDKPSTINNEIRSSLAEKYKSDDALILPGKDEMMNLIRNSRSSLVGGNTWEKLMLPEYFLVSIEKPAHAFIH
jgi:hypothetical protein